MHDCLNPTWRTTQIMWKITSWKLSILRWGRACCSATFHRAGRGLGRSLRGLLFDQNRGKEELSDFKETKQQYAMEYIFRYKTHLYDVYVCLLSIWDVHQNTNCHCWFLIDFTDSDDSVTLCVYTWIRISIYILYRYIYIYHLQGAPPPINNTRKAWHPTRWAD